MQNDIKRTILSHLVAVIAILCFSLALFHPAISGGRIIGPDSISSAARYKYIKDYKDATGETARWNPSQFSGDPRVLAVGKDLNLLGYLHKAITLNISYPIGVFFGMGLMMYLSLCLMRVNNWLALSVSLAYMLSYIFFTLYEAGHGQKIMTLIYCPLIISGGIMLLGKQKLNGIFTFIIGTSLAIYVGHVQMVFYLVIALIAFGVPLLVFSFVENKTKSFFTGLGITILISLIAVGTDYTQLNTSYAFSKQTMRGGSLLKEKSETQVDTKDNAGLDWDYAMSWSFESKEFLSILIPRIAGGGSQEKIDKENPLAKLMIQNGAKVENNQVAVPAYWGNMPFTSGGIYIGASIFSLFILSLLLVDRKYAFAFGSAFVVIFLLSLGKNAEWFNRLLFDYLPMFSKFRAPSSILSILPAFMFLQVGMGINKLIEQEDRSQLFKKVLIGGGISISFLVMVYLIGISSFSFLSNNDAGYDFNIQSVLIEGRKALFLNDLKRSFIFTIIVLAAIFLFVKNILKSKYAFVALLAGIFILDILPVDRRLINSDDFISKTKFESFFAARPADVQITNAEPKGRGYYRVLDLSVNTFNDAKSCYYHNQIGGYSAVKTQRYQDIIDYHIAKNNFQVLNMLNTKYIITKEGKVQQNPGANGPAWFVNDIQYVNSDMDEITALSEVNTAEVAVIKKDEFSNLGAVGDGQGEISLSTFSPNKMTYSSNSNSDQIAIFSETWFNGPGWKAYVDGKETAIFRANYLLRGIEVPSGSHEIIMEFKPNANGGFISIICSILAILILIGVILVNFGILKIDKLTALNE